VNTFEAKFEGKAVRLFLFDNAPSYQKRAGDTLSACKLPKKPTANWTHYKDGLWMRNSCSADGSEHEFYFLESHPMMPGWFKGMEILI